MLGPTSLNSLEELQQLLNTLNERNDLKAIREDVARLSERN